jgi:hypothetical protein
MTEIVFNGRDNKARITISQDGVPMDFAAIVRMTLSLAGRSTVIDSDSDPAHIAWSAGDGVVEFDLGEVSVAPGLYQATLVAYDALHTDGQVLAHPAAAQLLMRFVR